LGICSNTLAKEQTINVNNTKTSVTPLIKLERDPNVNLKVNEAIVIDVLKALVDQTGYSLIVSGKKEILDSTINRIEFNNIKLSEAISFILYMKGLTARKVNRTIFISDEEELKRTGVDDSIMKNYKVRNMKPSEAIKKIDMFYTTGKAKPQMIPNDDNNILSVIGRPVQIDFLESVLSIVDKKIPQVMIEIKLVEVNEQASKTLGMSYGYGQKQFGAAFNNSAQALAQQGGMAVGGAGATPLQSAAVANAGAPPVNSPGIKLDFQTLRNFTANFNAELNALISDSKAKVLSNPRIATQSGKPAQFSATEDVPIIETTQTATGATQAVRTLQIGEVIKVTPLMIDTEEGFVTLELNPSISSRGKDVIVNGNPVPERIDRQLKTTMKVKSGESIVLGGLKRKNTSTASNKLPILGDIPFIGALFGANSVSESETELILMVTPYILDDSANNPNEKDEK
jgi:type II secretory pathway component GspD/PulD (secretin)